MAQGRSTEIISMIKWIRTSRLSIKKSLSGTCGDAQIEDLEGAVLKRTPSRFARQLKNLLIFNIFEGSLLSKTAPTQLIILY